MMNSCRRMGSLRPISGRRMHGLRPIARRSIYAIRLPTALGRMMEAAMFKPFGQVALINPSCRIIVRVFVCAVMLGAGTVPVTCLLYTSRCV